MVDLPSERDAASQERLLTLEEALAAEREANRRKDEFLAILSHDLRSPLSAILTWISVLRHGSVAPDDRDRALDSIERIAKLAARMVEDLLDISRIASGKISLSPQECDLAVIVRSAAEMVLPVANEKGIDVDVSIDPTCLPMRGDPARLHQMIGNLLSNALKFTPAGGRVQVGLVCPNGMAEIHVTDTGDGIAPEMLPHVFQPFRQATTSVTRRGDGLGLGLAIARHLAELHGGSIAAESAGLGRGATFSVRLPLQRLPALSAPSAAPLSPLEATPSLSGIRVLLVDDDPDACLALETVLRLAGSPSVRTARSVAEAIRMFEEERPDILVTDVIMPDRDGYALLAAVRERTGNLPAIALTAAATPEDRRKVADAGFDLHITKPVDPADLVEAIAMTASGQGHDFAWRRLQAVMKGRWRGISR